MASGLKNKGGGGLICKLQFVKKLNQKSIDSRCEYKQNHVYKMLPVTTMTPTVAYVQIHGTRQVIFGPNYEEKKTKGFVYKWCNIIVIVVIL